MDGEHYPPVIRAALREVSINHELRAAVFIGGREKIVESGQLFELDVPMIVEDDAFAGVRKAIEEFRPDLLFDLSDEPVVDYVRRLAFANLALGYGVSYVGADFRFDPVPFADIVQKPSLSIIGTGKRVGKTAVSAYLAREIRTKAKLSLCVVVMGRGGPEEPELLRGDQIELTPEALLQASREGKHAASDYYEDALMSRIVTIGCRRCGGGLAGAPFISNVEAGAHLANSLDVDMVIFEGSGAALPPVRTDRRMTVVGAGQPEEYLSGYFGPYRLTGSELVVLSGCEETLASGSKINRLHRAVKEINGKAKVVHTIFRPQPLRSIAGQRVFLATTAPDVLTEITSSYLEEKFECRIVGVTTSLADRQRLRKELAGARGKYDVLLTELKAAAVDVATQIGLEEGAEIVYADNMPVTVGGDGDLSELALELVRHLMGEQKHG